MFHRLVRILLLVGLATGPLAAGRMAVDLARTALVPSPVAAIGEVCGDGPSGTGTHAHCDYCQIATPGMLTAPAIPLRQARRRITPTRRATARRLVSPRRWHRPPSNAPPRHT
ncbi:hypothetical protein OEZ60_01055 [Defluviimonas sp. WL0024]|uniref:DUF2946 domain-containing protein n=1 Tax=Albidovulum salinarum TaxID=2984153 RepID=A0ABT2WY35_9RHOB|nr:hypothetical protein [Defluviimonas sp. WL0024]MCU9846593.1 hypothetical protein [Defluviimonas sp. WL0024]